MKISSALILRAGIEDHWLRATVNKNVAACHAFITSLELMQCGQDTQMYPQILSAGLYPKHVKYRRSVIAVCQI